jgi:hypothetical protein
MKPRPERRSTCDMCSSRLDPTSVGTLPGAHQLGVHVAQGIGCRRRNPPQHRGRGRKRKGCRLILPFRDASCGSRANGFQGRVRRAELVARSGTQAPCRYRGLAPVIKTVLFSIFIAFSSRVVSCYYGSGGREDTASRTTSSAGSGSGGVQATQPEFDESRRNSARIPRGFAAVLGDSWVIGL